MRSSNSSSLTARCGGPRSSRRARQRKQEGGDVQLVGGTIVHPPPTAGDVAVAPEAVPALTRIGFSSCAISHAPRSKGEAAWTPSCRCLRLWLGRARRL